MMRLLLPTHTPSYKGGYAHSKAEAKYPQLWPGLVGAWFPSLGPSGSTLRDVSNRGNHGTLTNMDPATDWVIAGKKGLGWALDFDGGDDYVTFGDKSDFELPRYSYAFWLRAVSAPDVAVITQPILNGAGEQFHFSWGHTSPAYRQSFMHKDSGGWKPAQIPDTLSGGVWYHLAATYNGSYIRGFLDGRQVVQVSAGTPNVSAGDLFLNRPSYELACKIALFEVWNRPLPLDQIQLLHARPMALLEWERKWWPVGAVETGQRYWIATTAKNWSDTSAWSMTDGGAGGAAAPTATEDVFFNGNGTGDCTIDLTGSTAKSFSTAAAYTGTIDFATKGFVFQSGSSNTFAHNGTLNLGSATIDVKGTLLDYSGVTTLTDSGGPHFTFFENTTWTPKSHYNVNGVTISIGTTVTLSANRIDITAGTLGVYGNFVVNGTCYPRQACETRVYAGGSITGTGTLGFIAPDAGKGLLELSGTITTSTMLVQYWAASSGPLIAGTYGSASVQFLQPGTGNNTVTFGSGAFVFSGDVTVSHTSTGSLVLDLSTNSPSVTVQGDLTFALSGSGNVTVYSIFGSPTWTLQGDVVHTESSSGSLLWSKGSGSITASGSANQSWGFGSPGTLEAITVNKAGGTLTLTTALTCASLTHQAGTIDPNGQTITVNSDCTIQTGAKIDTASDALDGSTWTIYGDFDWQGTSGNVLALNATAAWTLSVSGSASARYVSVAYSDASGGTTIDALGGSNTDNENNINWLFTRTLVGGVSVAQAGVGSTSVANTGIGSISVSQAGVGSVSAAPKTVE